MWRSWVWQCDLHTGVARSSIPGDPSPKSAVLSHTRILIMSTSIITFGYRVEFDLFSEEKKYFTILKEKIDL